MTEHRRPAQLTAENAAAFTLRDVVEHYHLRTPYPPSLGLRLRSLIVEPNAKILELGCGTG